MQSSKQAGLFRSATTIVCRRWCRPEATETSERGKGIRRRRSCVALDTVAYPIIDTSLQTVGNSRQRADPTRCIVALDPFPADARQRTLSARALRRSRALGHQDGNRQRPDDQRVPPRNAEEASVMPLVGFQSHGPRLRYCCRCHLAAQSVTGVAYGSPQVPRMPW